jgi:hypothetical protein
VAQRYFVAFDRKRRQTPALADEMPASAGSVLAPLRRSHAFQIVE